MTVTHSAITSLINASRKASRLSDILSSELSHGATTVIDEIYGHILDALISMRNEPPVDLELSETARIVSDPAVSPESATDTLLR